MLNLRDWRSIRLDPRVPIVVATKNRDKFRELKEIWGTFEPGLVIAGDDYPDVDETGATYEENAVAKAAALAAIVNGPALADDSGIEVAALGGAPGVRSARTPRVGASSAERNEHILQQVEGKSRDAQFVSVCALVVPGYEPVISTGSVEGTIAQASFGSQGFGYDPIFWYQPYTATFGQVEAPKKHAVSHRGNALRGLQGKLLRLLTK